MPAEPLKTEVHIDPAIGAVEVKITARVEDEDLVLRAHKVKRDVDDTTVKTRPVDPQRIPIDWTKTRGALTFFTTGQGFG